MQVPSERMPVLILGSGVTALGAFRVLAHQRRVGYQLGLPDPLLRRSRYFRSAPIRGGPFSEARPLSEYLSELPFERAILLPCSDEAVLQTADLDSSLKHRYPSFVAPRRVLEQFIDKERFSELARVASVPQARSWRIGTVSDLDQIPEEAFRRGFLKPRDSQAFFARYGVKGIWVTTRDVARKRFEELSRSGLSMQFQVYVDGPPTAHVFLDGFADEEGRVRTLLARRRLRMHPSDFGNSTAMTTIPLGEVRPAVESLQRLIAAAGFRGIFSAEFKRNPDSGEYCVIEVNVRAWWYVRFAAQAGVDVCEWYVRAALGDSFPAQAPYTLGARCVYPSYDLTAIQALRRQGKANWFDFVQGLLGASQPIWTWSDPLPAAVGTLLAIRSRIASKARLFQRKRFREVGGVG